MKNLYDYRQPTYHVAARTEEEKIAFAASSLCLIRDWNRGWFEIPLSMRDEFIETFGIGGVENSACRSNITKAEIESYNASWLPMNLPLEEQINVAKKQKKKTNEKEEFSSQHVR